MERCYIKYLNKNKGFQVDTVYFDSYEEAVIWAKSNLGNFNIDMIHYY